MVAHCGLVTPPEDAVAMAEAVRKLAGNAQVRETLGAAARRHALDHLHVDAVLAAAEREFAAVIGPRAAPAPQAADAARRDAGR